MIARFRPLTIRPSRAWCLSPPLVLVAGALAVLPGCALSSLITQVEAKDTKTFAFEVASAPSVVVETFNGAVTVARGEPGAISCEVTRKARAGTLEQAEARLDEVVVTPEQEGDAIRIVASLPGKGSGLGASFVLTVPEGASVRLDSNNGAIEVTDVAGPVAADTSNGRITVRGARGPLDLDTSNGAIEVLADDVAVDAETSNGAITFAGLLRPGDHRFETSNGSVTLRLPAGSTFALNASTSNGRVSTDFEGLGGPSKTLSGTVGPDPAASIRVRTSNGSVSVLKQ